MKYILITGASSGIGYESSKKFAKLGKNLILVARRTEKLEELKLEIKKINENVDVVLKSVDLSISKNVIDLYEDLKKYEIETLINNAGFGNFSPFAESDMNKIQKMIHVNIEALTILTTLYVKDYENVEGTQIINTSSVAGYKLVQNGINYCATKFYVSALTEGLYAELKARGAKLTAKILAPAATSTEFFNVAFNDENLDVSSKYPRIDSPEKMAGYLIELYQSDKCLGFVNRDTFEFSLTDPKLEFWK